MKPPLVTPALVALATVAFVAAVTAIIHLV